MAKETEKNQEKSLQAIDTAIASLRTQDWDLNPYSVAAAAELEPEDVFSSKAAMDKIMAARGDGSTYSHDAVLAGRCKELEAELDNAASINQDLYDRGSELAERVLELEASVVELEQEAETLALQLQNSWSLGYQKGLAEGRQQASLPPEQRLESEQKPQQKPASKTGEHPVVEPEIKKTDAAGTITDEDLPTESQLKNSLNQQRIAAEAQHGLVTAAESTPTQTAQVQESPVQESIAEPALAIVDAAGYNDKVYNAVSDHRSPISVSEIYGALSWKQIETVYQYSTVAGRPNTNLYFEPLNSEPEENQAPLEQQVPATETQVAGKQVAEKQIVEKQAQEQPITEERADASAESAQESASHNRSTPAKAGSKLPHISFDPPEEPIVGAPQSKPIVRASDLGEPDFINQYDGGLTGENFPSLDSLQTAAAARKDSATYDKLDALPAQEGEVPDILDLDQLDIFEGMEDIDELSKIEVIEDVVLAAPNANMISQSETAAMPKVSGEDLRDLIKSRIKQAQDHDPQQQHSLDQLLDAANASEAEPPSGDITSPDPAKAAAEEIPGTAAIDLEALRHGARNKFVGGKSPATSSPPNTSTSPTGETSAPNPGAASAGAAAGAGGAPTPRVAPIPADIRKHCMMLGVRADELTIKVVIEAWKAQITAPGVHPDQGGDTETAVYLNLAKDSLIKYIEAQAPKLGKKFGQPSQARDSQSKPFTMRQGPDKDTDKK
ncbi:MAG: hypothetical protein Q8T09_18155 [Candidatus Melainabacteria bacterium]|nr:hypothetical protein [Candidatus Melainabacteria bacterium]